MAIPSFDDLYALGQAEMLLRRPDLFIAPGDIPDLYLAMAAAMADKNNQYTTESLRKTFLDSSNGQDLTDLVYDRYNITRNAATAATVTLRLGRTSGALPAGTLDAGFVVSTEPDENGERQEFTLNTSVSWALSESANKSVVATAVIAGRKGNVGAGTITNLVGAPFDSVITVTNLAVAGGGNEEESDDHLRERARQFALTIRRGTLAALEYGAKTVESVRVATATEDDNGNVTVFVTDEDGNSTITMTNEVTDELENWRVAGPPVSVIGGTVLSTDVEVELVLKDGAVVELLDPDVQAAITARMAKLPVGNGDADSLGVLRLEIIQAAAISVDPDNIVGVNVIAPVANVTPAAGQIIRAGTITVTEA